MTQQPAERGRTNGPKQHFPLKYSKVLSVSLPNVAHGFKIVPDVVENFVSVMSQFASLILMSVVLIVVLYIAYKVYVEIQALRREPAATDDLVDMKKRRISGSL